MSTMHAGRGKGGDRRDRVLLLTQRLRQMESERSIFCLWDTALCPVVLDQQEPPGGRAGYNFFG